MIFYLYSGDCMEGVRIRLFPCLCPFWFLDGWAFFPRFLSHPGHMLSTLLCSFAENITVPGFVNPQFHYLCVSLHGFLSWTRFSLDLLQILQYINLLLFIFIIKNSCSLRRLKKNPYSSNLHFFCKYVRRF